MDYTCKSPLHFMTGNITELCLSLQLNIREGSSKGGRGKGGKERGRPGEGRGKGGGREGEGREGEGREGKGRKKGRGEGGRGRGEGGRKGRRHGHTLYLDCTNSKTTATNVRYMYYQKTTDLHGCCVEVRGGQVVIIYLISRVNKKSN